MRELQEAKTAATDTERVMRGLANRVANHLRETNPAVRKVEDIYGRLLCNDGFFMALSPLVRLSNAPDAAKSLALWVAFAFVDTGGADSFAIGTGKSWKALREFPHRLTKMADEVERINGSIAFGDSTSKVEFECLATILREYAAWVRQRVNQITSINRAHPARGHSPLLVCLSKEVRQLTGRFCDEEVAKLLNAASQALNANREFDAQTISNLRYRSKSK